MKIKVFIDGASKGNPGESGIGIIIKDESGNVRKIKKYLGRNLTNNQAEYKALLTALKNLKDEKNGEITIHTDSELVANQINGLWKVRDSKLKVLFLKAKNYMNDFPNLTLIHVRREFNREADKLANQSIYELVN